MMSNQQYARSLLELSEDLATAFVAFSGKQSAGVVAAIHEVTFETTMDMVRSGFEPSYGLTTIASLTMPGKPTVPEITEDELFGRAFRAATAVLCLYIHSIARSTMTPANADQFDNAIQSSVARLCAGKCGFDAEPYKVFETIQALIRQFLSKTWIDERSVGKDDCLGKILGHLAVSPDGQTRYAFIVGSERQPSGCAALFFRALRQTQTLFSS